LQLLQRRPTWGCPSADCDHGHPLLLTALHRPVMCTGPAAAGTTASACPRDAPRRTDPATPTVPPAPDTVPRYSASHIDRHATRIPRSSVNQRYNRRPFSTASAHSSSSNWPHVAYASANCSSPVSDSSSPTRAHHICSTSLRTVSVAILSLQIRH